MLHNKIGLIALLIVMSAPVAQATTYYVRTDGNNVNTGLINSPVGAWRTIDFASKHVAAGDVVRVQAGTYAETAAPSVNGTSGNTVTLVADGAVTTCGMSFSAKSYIRIIGFTFDGNASGCSNSTDLITSAGTSTGLEFWNDTVTNTTGKAYVFDFVGNGALCNQCIWFGGTVSNIGVTNTQVAVSPDGNDVFVGYVKLNSICYVGIGPTGLRGRFVNNNFSSLIACGGSHPDNYYFHGLSLLGYSNNLIESNWVDGTPTSTDNKVFHAEVEVQVSWNDNVFRLNVNHDQGSASAYSIYTTHSSTNQGINRWRQYNNDFILGDRALSGDQYDGCGGGQAISSGSTISQYLYNNIAYKCWADTASIRTHVNPFGGNLSASYTQTSDYNLAYDPAATVTFQPHWTSQAHEQSNVNPGFVDVANLDFHLTSGGGARGVGGPLTTASGSGSGTSLTVAANTGSFFIGDNSSNLPQYGGKLVPGDFITVGVTPVQVLGVSGDVLTLASAISWNNGDPVYFGTSPTIDIGAYPYKTGGYNLTATYTQSGGTVNVTPSDPSLVRFVVCYENAIPTAVVNASPYTCPYGGGTLDVRVYPRYASQTLYVEASTVGSVSPCDVNSDGSTNVSDVQLCVNQAIGVISCMTGDINKDGTCNVIDVQRDVNAALGGACVSP